MRLALLLLIAISNTAWAVSIAELQSAQRLQISAELQPASNIVPGQKVELIIKIATDRWFTSGTRLEIPEVAGLVILQTNNFASNSSETRGGQSWVIQRWSLDIFPQRAGRFTIPAVTATVSVNDGASTEGVSGELFSPELDFRVSIPENLVRAEHWVAAPMFKVSQNFDRELESLQVGDAFQRQVIFEATDVLAMMLPTLEPEKLAGLTAYPEPPSLINNSNRGQTSARRVESISYIATEQGQYQLPARDFYWWDTTSAEVQIKFLPAVEISVGEGSGEGKEEPGARVYAAIRAIDPLLLLTSTVLLAAFAALAVVAYRRFPQARVVRLITRLESAWRQLLALRNPALPRTLNPDSSAGE